MSIIVDRNVEDLKRFITQTYGVAVDYITTTNRGLDNSVYIVHSANNKKYVFKIIETKPYDSILKAVNISRTKCKTVVWLKYLEIIGKRNKIISIYLPEEKPAYLYEFREGNHFYPTNDLQCIAIGKFICYFHSLKSDLIFKSCQTFVKELIKEVNIMLTDAVFSGIDFYFNKEFPHLADLLKSVNYNSNTYINEISPQLLPIGLTHGDLTPENVIENCKAFELIDCDSVNLNNWCLIDLLQYSCKTDIMQNEKKLLAFLSSYNSSYLKQEYVVNFSITAQVFCIKCLLSTMYYCFEKKKITPLWINKNAIQGLTILYKNAFFLQKKYLL